jgi:hypothetical protein
MINIKSIFKKVFTLFILIILGGIITSCTKENKKTGDSDSTNVVKQDSIKFRTYSNFLFVGYYYGKPSLYEYEFADKKYKVIWNDYKESVILLLFDPDKPVSFFLTARGYGKKENHAYVNRIKLYHCDNKSEEIILVEEIGSGIQVSADWNSDGNIEIQYTAVDKTVASFINKYRKVYNSFGTLVDDEMEAFDLTKEGYPELIPRRSSTISPSGKYGITISEDSLFLKVADLNERDFISLISHNINNVDWNQTENTVFISTLDLSSTIKIDKVLQTSELIIFDIQNKNLISRWNGNGFKNFESLNNHFIFDNGFDNKSTICIYDYVKQDTIDIIKTYNGCGLSFIPTFEQ